MFNQSPIKDVGTNMATGQIMSRQRYNSLPQRPISLVQGNSPAKNWQNPNITIKRKAMAAKM